MSNRKKLKNNTLRLKKFDVRGIAKKVLEPHPRESVPTADEIFSTVAVPEDAAVVIKVVPAKVDGTIVGDAYLHDDGSVAIKYYPDAPQWALDKIKATANEVGYSLEEGAPLDGAS